MIKIPIWKITAAASIFLLLPLILFLLFWLSPILSLPILFFIFYCFKPYLSELKTNKESFSISYKALSLGTLIILTWILYGGVGKFGYQNFDYVKHNSIFLDLMNNSWPVLLKQGESSYYLVYYLGYYIMPALFGKIGGLAWLEIANVIQVYIALMLVWFLFLIHAPFKRPLVLLLIFIFWGGLDLFGSYVFYQEYSHQFGEFPEWWAGASNFQFTGFSDLLYWVPQHALGGWLTTLLCFYVLQKKMWRIMPFVVALSLLWTPFATIGLLPFLLIAFFQQNSWKSKIEWCTSRFGLLALLLLTIFALFYSASLFDQPFKWQWEKMGQDEFIPRYILFLILEIGFTSAVFIWGRKSLPKTLYYFGCLAIAYLVLCPHLYVGVFSDFAMRSSVPMLCSLFLISMIIFEKFYSPKISGILFLYLLLCSYSAISDVYRAQKLKHIVLGYSSAATFDPNGLSMQYLGSPEHPFFKYFSRK